jgi:hypothetical protein
MKAVVKVEGREHFLNADVGMKITLKSTVDINGVTSQVPQCRFQWQATE